VVDVDVGLFGGITCALLIGGEVRCWGSGEMGLAGGTYFESSQPVTIPDLPENVTKLSVSTAHACVLTAEGQVHCWGNNIHGQLGYDTGTPGDIEGLAGATADVRPGGAHTCALSIAGGVKCWGWNAYGQVGDGTVGVRSLPVDVMGLTSGVGRIATGITMSCAVTLEGAVKCWGFGGSTMIDGYYVQATAVDVAGLDGDIVDLGIGFDWACALNAGGTVRCWSRATGTAQPIAGMEDGIASIAVGMSRVCALTEVGSVLCWSPYNYYGELGNGSSGDYGGSGASAVVGLQSGVAAIASGDYHVCALLASGGVKCWGNNDSGQLGIGTDAASATTPQDVVGLSTGVQSIAAGGGHTCALLTSGPVKCWGFNFFGALGTGDLTNRSVPTDVVGLRSPIAAVRAGSGHTCALTVAGGVSCWGWNDWGQLGIGTSRSSSRPAAVRLDSDNDGCTDSKELTATATIGGQRDPLDAWDFFDTPTLPDLQRDKRITVGDIMQEVTRFGASGDTAVDPLSPPPADGYHTAYDRGDVDGPNAWNRAPADGSITVADITAVVSQFGHTCV
jgi:alpha-tubulin suppressor-like RCC1 family protein